ncbi:MAG: hypothetical protein AB3N10_08270 [Allomuricauda sp.]
MSQAIHTVLNLSRPVDKLSFREVFWEKGSSSPDNASVRLSETQLISLVQVLFTYGLHYDEVSREQRPHFMESIKDNELGLFDIPMTFCAHLLNNLEEGARLEFGKLLEMDHDLKDLLSNEQLMDFVEMELIDPSVSFRKWEYGRYALDHMAKTFLGNVDWKSEQLALVKDNLKMKEYLDNFDSLLDRFGDGLDDHEKSLLLLMFKTKVFQQYATLMEYMLAGDIVQSNLVGLQLRKEQLATVLRTTLENSRSKGKDRGGPKP